MTALAQDQPQADYAVWRAGVLPAERPVACAFRNLRGCLSAAAPCPPALVPTGTRCVSRPLRNVLRDR